MEDFYYAGGLPAIVRALGEKDLLHKDALTVNGKSIWENCQQAPNYNADVIRPFDNPLRRERRHRGAERQPGAGRRRPQAVGGVAAPAQAHAAAPSSSRPSRTTTRASSDPNLDVDASCVLVLKNCGPKGYPGMAEVGNMGLPPKLLETGVTDMVRISDARMSGTAYGTVVLHVCPEAAVGGPLALVQERRHDRARRRGADADDRRHRRGTGRSGAQAWKAPEPSMKGGYQGLYVDHVQQANKGADLDFLVGCRGSTVLRESH